MNPYSPETDLDYDDMSNQNSAKSSFLLAPPPIPRANANIGTLPTPRRKPTFLPLSNTPQHEDEAFPLAPWSAPAQPLKRPSFTAEPIQRAPQIAMAPPSIFPVAAPTVAEQQAPAAPQLLPMTPQLDNTRPDALPGTYHTTLDPQNEAAFRDWVVKNRVPFDPAADPRNQDYDMRGFYRGLMSGDPHARQGVSDFDGQMHYSDYWKTPLHRTFSQESQWAVPGRAPQWQDDRLIGRDGRVIADETPQQTQQPQQMPRDYEARRARMDDYRQAQNIPGFEEAWRNSPELRQAWNDPGFRQDYMNGNRSAGSEQPFEFAPSPVQDALLQQMFSNKVASDDYRRRQMTDRSAGFSRFQANGLNPLLSGILGDSEAAKYLDKNSEQLNDRADKLRERQDRIVEHQGLDDERVATAAQHLDRKSTYNQNIAAAIQQGKSGLATRLFIAQQQDEHRKAMEEQAKHTDSWKSAHALSQEENARLGRILQANGLDLQGRKFDYFVKDHDHDNVISEARLAELIKNHGILHEDRVASRETQHQDRVDNRIAGIQKSTATGDETKRHHFAQEGQASGSADTRIASLLAGLGKVDKEGKLTHTPESIAAAQALVAKPYDSKSHKPLMANIIRTNNLNTSTPEGLAKLKSLMLAAGVRVD